MPRPTRSRPSCAHLGDERAAGRRGRGRRARISGMSERPADAVVCDALRGGLVTRALALVADLRVAHALAGGPRSVAELAREPHADADTLHRLLRALASDGVFAEEAPGVFRNTVASEVLTRDGWDDFAHLFGGIWLRAATAKDALKRLGLVSLGAVYQHFR